MKSLNKNFIAAIAIAILIVPGCAKKLEEQPYTVFSTEYFKTPEGLQAGIASLYSGFRYLYGPEGAVAMGVAGTDEWGMGDQARGGAAGDLTQLCLYTFGATNGQLLTPWNRSFSSINLANGLILFAPDVPISDADRNVALGEIRVLRALYYLILVQYFGAVPLDLGSGDLQFNQTPFQGFNRQSVNELLAKNYTAIIDDLTFATQNLPAQRPANAFRLSKAAALHLLAKAYMHRGYSSAAQAGDFQNAYDAAMEVINNQATYGTALQEYYADIHRPGNDYNSEILFSIERVPGNYAASEVPNPQGISGTKGMDASNDFCGDYTAVNSPVKTVNQKPVSARTVTYGRPIRRFCPTPWLFNTAFADKFNDSRFEGSFRTVYIASTTVGPFTADVDTAFVMARTNAEAATINAT
ncbi:MAG TPA: RagB/SusD family nutrient uptake outer membrane protein, partial [Chitinophagaceae bacterium]|nr:RagB/SusD family nutrient uptake outer membrane protein [Chitinophagaceae bacterium]